MKNNNLNIRIHKKNPINLVHFKYIACHHMRAQGVCSCIPRSFLRDENRLWNKTRFMQEK
jgi:hypothetical protein